MSWVKCSDRLPPEGEVVQAAFGGGSIMSMIYRGGLWWYAHLDSPTRHAILGWYEPDTDEKGA